MGASLMRSSQSLRRMRKRCSRTFLMSTLPAGQLRWPSRRRWRRRRLKASDDWGPHGSKFINRCAYEKDLEIQPRMSIAVCAPWCDSTRPRIGAVSGPRVQWPLRVFVLITRFRELQDDTELVAPWTNKVFVVNARAPTVITANSHVPMVQVHMDAAIALQVLAVRGCVNAVDRVGGNVDSLEYCLSCTCSRRASAREGNKLALACDVLKPQPPNIGPRASFLRVNVILVHGLSS